MGNNGIRIRWNDEEYTFNTHSQLQKGGSYPVPPSRERSFLGYQREGERQCGRLKGRGELELGPARRKEGKGGGGRRTTGEERLGQEGAWW